MFNRIDAHCIASADPRSSPPSLNSLDTDSSYTGSNAVLLFVVNIGCLYDVSALQLDLNSKFADTSFGTVRVWLSQDPLDLLFDGTAVVYLPEILVNYVSNCFVNGRKLFVTPQFVFDPTVFKFEFTSFHIENLLLLSQFNGRFQPDDSVHDHVTFSGVRNVSGLHTNSHREPPRYYPIKIDLDGTGGPLCETEVSPIETEKPIIELEGSFVGTNGSPDVTVGPSEETVTVIFVPRQKGFTSRKLTGFQIWSLVDVECEISHQEVRTQGKWFRCTFDGLKLPSKIARGFRKFLFFPIRHSATQDLVQCLLVVHREQKKARETKLSRNIDWMRDLLVNTSRLLSNGNNRSETPRHFVEGEICVERVSSLIGQLKRKSDLRKFRKVFRWSNGLRFWKIKQVISTLSELCKKKWHRFQTHEKHSRSFRFRWFATAAYHARKTNMVRQFIEDRRLRIMKQAFVLMLANKKKNGSSHGVRHRKSETKVQTWVRRRNLSTMSAVFTAFRKQVEKEKHTREQCRIGQRNHKYAIRHVLRKWFLTWSRNTREQVQEKLEMLERVASFQNLEAEEDESAFARARAARTVAAKDSLIKLLKQKNFNLVVDKTGKKMDPVTGEVVDLVSYTRTKSHDHAKRISQLAIQLAFTAQLFSGFLEESSRIDSPFSAADCQKSTYKCSTLSFVCVQITSFWCTSYKEISRIAHRCVTPEGWLGVLEKLVTVSKYVLQRATEVRSSVLQPSFYDVAPISKPFSWDTFQLFMFQQLGRLTDEILELFLTNGEDVHLCNVVRRFFGGTTEKRDEKEQMAVLIFFLAIQSNLDSGCGQDSRSTFKNILGSYYAYGYDRFFGDFADFHKEQLNGVFQKMSLYGHLRSSCKK